MAYINAKIQMQKKIKDTLSFWVWLVPAGGAWCVVRSRDRAAPHATPPSM
jgi:hypothetical protein